MVLRDASTDRDHARSAVWWTEPWIEKNGSAARCMGHCSHAHVFLSKVYLFPPSGSAFFCDCVGSLLLHGLSLVAASGGYSAVAVHWLLIAVASRCRAQALDHRPSSCGAQAWLLHSMQDLPGLGIKPMSPALAGGFFTTQPPGKPHKVHLQGSSQATVPSPTW